LLDVSRHAAGLRSGLAVAGVALLAVGIAQTSPGRTVLRKAGLLEPPVSYTSLAFEHPQSLPEQLSSQRANIPVSFQIHNYGNTVHKYEWSIVLTQGTLIQRLASGTAEVAAGHAAVISRNEAVSCTQGQQRIIVRLTEPAESIDAWMRCPRR
jgi:hypothetical protein